MKKIVVTPLLFSVLTVPVFSSSPEMPSHPVRSVLRESRGFDYEALRSFHKKWTSLTEEKQVSFVAHAITSFGEESSSISAADLTSETERLSGYLGTKFSTRELLAVIPLLFDKEQVKEARTAAAEKCVRDNSVSAFSYYNHYLKIRVSLFSRLLDSVLKGEFLSSDGSGLAQLWESLSPATKIDIISYLMKQYGEDGLRLRNADISIEVTRFRNVFDIELSPEEFRLLTKALFSNSYVGSENVQYDLGFCVRDISTLRLYKLYYAKRAEMIGTTLKRLADSSVDPTEGLL